MFVIETCNGNWDSAYEFSMWAAQIHLSVLSPGHLHSDVMTSVDWWDLPDSQIRHHLVHAKRAQYEIETGSAILWVYLWGMSSGYNPLLFRVTRMDGLMRSSLPLYTVERAIWSPLIFQCNHVPLTLTSRYSPPARVIKLLFFQVDVEADGNVRIEFDECDDGIDFTLVASPPIVYRAMSHL